MKYIDSFISIIKFLYGFTYLAAVSLIIAVKPQWELKLRKKASRILTKIISNKIIIEGKIDPHANIIMGNHTNNLDIPLMETVYGEEKIIWVAKDDIAKMPIFKYLVTKTEMILADRTDRRAIIKMIKEVKEKVNRGYKIAIFPEGTRNKGDYTKMLPFKNGPKGIVEKLNLKVQPFVIINMPKAFQKHPFRIEKQNIKVIFLESFYPYEGWYEKMQNQMQKIITKEYSNEN